MASSAEHPNRFSLPPVLLFLLLRASFFATVNGDALVTGTVFCDQCKDGSLSFFDYPIYGAKVVVGCGAGEVVEETTNLLGYYAVRFPGSPDLSRCYAQLERGSTECGGAAGPAQRLSLVFRMFGWATYTVEPLLAQPNQPVGFCPKPWPSPAVPLPPPPPLPLPPLPQPAPVTRLPLPPPPPLAIPFLEASACSFDKWLTPEFKCHWRVVAPETTVAVVFGPVAAGKYGAEMTLWEGLHGRGDVYRTLLREATAALLNSYHSFRFFYSTLSVLTDTNLALLGSQRQALMAALRFRRANSGISGGRSIVGCNLTPCPS
ncbi:hypothetical protein AXF42_Ash007702 [Apostasia shenzhenica]|uniref:Uncharacterized protein n=1 Tax=Apostasia shenzhenica TaxID=1088818 RepID=A0A2I0A679_9ASPA|nr:hypothetical protein AXF42_Ash007702 [Apostasia shenzhenica]